MKKLLLQILLSICFISIANAQEKGVLQEGYYFPGGGGYIQPASPQPVQNHGLDAQIAEAKNNYDSCMRNVKGEMGNDLIKNHEILIKRSECKRYMDIYENLIYSKHNVQKISGKSSVSNNNAIIRKKSSYEEDESGKNKQFPQHLNVQQHGGATDEHGTYYAPAGSGNMVNTKTGSTVIRQGGNTYLDTKTGQIIHGN